jgi:hypothetical protein
MVHLDLVDTPMESGSMTDLSASAPPSGVTQRLVPMR